VQEGPGNRREQESSCRNSTAGCRYFRGTLPSYCDSRSRATPSIPHVCSLSPHPFVPLIPLVITEDGCFASLPLQGNLAGVRHSTYEIPQRCGSIPRCTFGHGATRMLGITGEPSEPADHPMPLAVHSTIWHYHSHPGFERFNLQNLISPSGMWRVESPRHIRDC
jgi:hypothetical protein